MKNHFIQVNIFSGYRILRITISHFLLGGSQGQRLRILYLDDECLRRSQEQDIGNQVGILFTFYNYRDRIFSASVTCKMLMSGIERTGSDQREIQSSPPPIPPLR